MRRTLLAVVAVGMLAVIPASALSAQADVKLGVGAGLTLPMGDYKDADKLGFHGGIGLSFGLGTAPVRLGVNGTYSQTSHKDIGGTAVDGNSKIIGGMVDVIYPFGTPGNVKPYIMAGVGVFNVKVKADAGPGATVDTSETKIGFGGGAGLNIGPGFFVQGRFVSVSTSDGSTPFIRGTVGYRFALGKKKTM